MGPHGLKLRKLRKKKLWRDHFRRGKKCGEEVDRNSGKRLLEVTLGPM